MILLLLLACLPIGALGASTNDVEVRVLLSTGGADSLSLTVTGAYSVNGVSFTGGTLTASLDGSAVSVKHSSKGTLQSAASVRIVRSTAAYGDAYLHFSNSKHGERDYLGDMVLVNDGGTLRLINYVGLREYLYGAVSGELSDSSHAELLKTQTIIAKGFAYAEVLARTSKLFDVYDTTTSQIYLGYVPQDVNTIAAVDAVWENTLLYNGSVVKTYYCTANGGQVLTPRMVWGGASNDGAYSFRFDPYDLRGSSANVSVAIDGAQPQQLPSALYAYLVKLANAQVSGTVTGLVSVDAMQGYYSAGDTAGSVRYPIDRAPQESISCTLTVSVSGKADAACTVSFTPAELIGSGAVSASGGIRFVTATAAGKWELVYGVSSGHRAGLSHRGAGQLAKLGYSYVDILKFYYSGASLTTPAGTVLTSSATFPETGGGVTATAAPTVTPDSGETPLFYGYINADDSNFRSGPSTAYSLLGVLNRGDAVAVYEKTGNWYRIVRLEDGQMGYVYAPYVTASDTSPSPTSSPTATPTPTASPTSRPAPTTNEGIKPTRVGDVNGDGQVNAADAASLLRYSVKIEAYNARQIIAGNVNGDLNTDTADAAYVLRSLVKLEPTI